MERVAAKILGRKVDADQQEVVKFLPDAPPSKGEVVLVDGTRCRVTRVRIEWDDLRWRIVELRVKEATQ